MIQCNKKTFSSSFFSPQQEPTKEEIFFSFLVVFFAFAHTYDIPGLPITIGEILMFICIPFYFKRGMRIPIDKQEIGFVLWFVYMSIISMALGIVFDAPLSKYFSIARTGFYWVIIFYFGKDLFNRAVFEKWMFIFSIVLSIYMLTQFFVFTITGFYIPGLIYGLPISNGAESGMATYQHSLNMAKWFGYVRPHGFLGEPAQCAQFLFIGITTLICNNEVLFKKKILLVILFSAAVIVSQSTTGIVLLGLAWLLFISIEKRLSVYRLPLVLVFVAICFYVVFSGNESSFSSVNRVINIANGSEIDDSSSIRLNNGMNLFSELPFAFKIFGTGAGLSEYVFSNLDFRNANLYMNALAGIFFNTGIIGGGLWIASLIVMFLMSGLLGKSLVVGFFIMTLGCSIYCQPQMVWFFLLILADIKEKNAKYSRYSAVR
jgi:hypothetical protein